MILVTSQYWYASGKTWTDLQQRFRRKEAIAQFTGDQLDGKFQLKSSTYFPIDCCKLHCTAGDETPDEKFGLKLGKIPTFLCATTRVPAWWQSAWLMIRTKLLNADGSKNGCMRWSTVAKIQGTMSPLFKVSFGIVTSQVPQWGILNPVSIGTLMSLREPDYIKHCHFKSEALTFKTFF